MHRPGRMPELFLKDDNGEIIETISLSVYDSVNDIHNLMIEKGFEKKAKSSESQNEL